MCIVSLRGFTLLCETICEDGVIRRLSRYACAPVKYPKIRMICSGRVATHELIVRYRQAEAGQKMLCLYEG